VITVLEAISEWVGRAVAWLTLGMVLVTFLVVVLRYGFSTGWIAMQESINYMHALVFLLGAAYTLRHNEHVRVDIFYQRWGPRRRAWVNLLGVIFLLLPTAAFIVWASWDYVAASWAVRETSPEAGGLPWVYLLKTVIPVSAALLGAQGIAMGLRALAVVLGWVPEERHAA
jgi:TRAP-type mannitol/chloroaromatic compound transport system permease small subunit